LGVAGPPPDSMATDIGPKVDEAHAAL
jgi:hypothetical protein